MEVIQPHVVRGTRLGWALEQAKKNGGTAVKGPTKYTTPAYITIWDKQVIKEKAHGNGSKRKRVNGAAIGPKVLYMHLQLYLVSCMSCRQQRQESRFSKVKNKSLWKASTENWHRHKDEKASQHMWCQLPLEIFLSFMKKECIHPNKNTSKLEQSLSEATDDRIYNKSKINLNLANCNAVM